MSLPLKKLGQRLLLLLALTVAGCSSPPQKPSAPAVVTGQSVIPRLSPVLKKEPLASGSYWAHVTQWRNTWEETLKSLQPK